MWIELGENAKVMAGKPAWKDGMGRNSFPFEVHLGADILMADWEYW